jgi:uncharacterized protein YjiS (DUF1127 family)
MATFTLLRSSDSRNAFAEQVTGATPMATLVGRLTGAIARAYRARRDTRQLMALSDHMLRDMGLGRSEVGHAVRFGRDGL